MASYIVVPALSFLSTFTSQVQHIFSASPQVNRGCKCMPGDACWPSSVSWSDFNDTVDGRLIATIPLAKSCHDVYFDAAACAALQAEWIWPEVHYNTSSSVMAPPFTNNSCSPFTPPSHPCTLGNYVSYAVNVSEPEHIARTLKFADEHNIRFVIRNTGHDYIGKSTGAGAIAVWMHNLKGIDFLDISTSTYAGKAIKMGAGVQGIEAYRAAHKKGLTVVGGECPTVGIAGGYTQGGGHSALSSKFGLAADQTLEWEVITGNGTLVKANANENEDLYWALSGGGGGTYGVVWSLTVKAHLDFPTAGLNLTFTSEGVSADDYWRAVSTFTKLSPFIGRMGAMAIVIITDSVFSISPMTGPEITQEYLKGVLQPLLDTLDELGIPYALTAADFPTYLDEYNAMQQPLPVGVAQYGGWLIPKRTVRGNNDGLIAAYRNLTAHGVMIIAVILDVSLKGIVEGSHIIPPASNAVNPAWRDTVIDTVLTTPLNLSGPVSDWHNLQTKMTEEYVPQLSRLAPDSGCYLNEADPYQPSWKTVFYGKNYEKLRAIKKKYDPKDAFYATTAVGSDEWVIQQGGRLCRAG